MISNFFAIADNGLSLTRHFISRNQPDGLLNSKRLYSKVLFLPAAISCLYRDESGGHGKINMEWDEVAKQLGTRGRIACMKKWSYMQARDSV